MIVEADSVPVRWLNDEEREGLRRREVSFLLTLPGRTAVRVQCEGVPLDVWPYPGPTPQRRHLYVQCDTPGFGPEHVRRLGIAAKVVDSPPTPPGPTDVEHISHITTLDEDISYFELVNWPPALFPGILTPIVTFAPPIDVLLDLVPLSPAAAARILRRRWHAFRLHRDEDPRWETTATDNEDLLTGVVAQTNRLFRAGLVVRLGHASKKRLRAIRDACDREGINLRPIPFAQECCAEVFRHPDTALLPVTRLIDAVSLSHLGIFEWPTESGSDLATPMGLDPDHVSIVAVDRTNRPNPSALVLGSPGSGKSTFAKLELLRTLGRRASRAVIFDPEGEYTLLTQHLQGEVVRLSDVDAPLNPLALYAPDDLDGKLLRMPALMAGRLGPEAVRRSRLVLHRAYRTGCELTLVDVVSLLPPDDPIRDELWPLTDGPLRGLGRARWGLPSRNVVSFDLSGFGAESISLAVPYLLELVLTWARSLTKTEALHVALDEVHLFLRDRMVRTELLALLKRARKTGVVLTGITQNVGDFFLTDEGALILANAGFVILFRQSPEDLKLLSDRLRLSAPASAWLEVAAPGEGLIVDRFVRPLRVLASEDERSLTDTTPLSFRRRT